MTRSEKHHDTVKLSVGNWIAFFGVVVVIVGSAWQFTNEVTDEISGLRSDVRAINSRFDGVERRVERVEEKVIYGLRLSHPNSASR